MNTMKKSAIMIRVMAVLSVVMMFTMCFVGGTFAKYTSSVNGDDTARVAKWQFNFGADDTQIGQELTFNLFDYTDANVDVNGKDDDAKVIAPGTTGSFVLELENVSEVNATYTIVLSETNSNQIPIQYSLDGTSWSDSITDLNSSLANKTVNIGDHPSYTLYWRWVFEGTTSGAHVGQNDTSDTNLGTAGTAEVTVNASITVTQVD